MRNIGAAVCAAALVCAVSACAPRYERPAAPKAAAPKAAAAPKRIVKNSWQELNLTGDWNMDLQILRALSDIWHGEGDIGEILDVGSRIRGTS